MVLAAKEHHHLSSPWSQGLLVRKLPGEIIKRNGFPPQILHSLSAWINVSLSKPLTNSHVSSGRWITLLKLCKSYDGSVVNWRKYLLSNISNSVVLFWSILISFDWLLLFGKYLTFSFSYLSLRVSLTLGERENIANQLCYQTLKGQKCTGYLRESVKAISSLISHLVANNPRGIPNGLPTH